VAYPAHTAKEIGKNVVAVNCDVSKLEDLEHLHKKVAGRKDKIDILFANAGTVETVETPAVTPDHFDRTFNTNARGAYFTVQKALPLLNDGGSIILTSSVVWQKGMPIYATYAASKAAVRSYVRTWTAEFAGRGIRANVISPGPIETPILDGQFSTKEADDELGAQFKGNLFAKSRIIFIAVSGATTWRSPLLRSCSRSRRRSERGLRPAADSHFE
jgi:NAD(P)-dependent dehydrogenase (short-subunit alcohol dehydrogenase family)